MPTTITVNAGSVYIDTSGNSLVYPRGRVDAENDGFNLILTENGSDNPLVVEPFAGVSVTGQTIASPTFAAIRTALDAAGFFAVPGSGGGGGGDASAANQVLGNASLASIDGKTPALQNGAVPITEPALILTGQAAQTAVVNNILEATAGATPSEWANYRSASVQVISTGTGGTFIFEQSNDGTNWRPLPVFNAELVTGVAITAAITASASQIVYTFPIRCRYVRLRIATTITGGSIQAFSRVSTEPWTAAVQAIAQPTAGNLNATIASLPTGTNLAADFAIQVRANATGAASATPITSPATPAGQSVKGSAGRLLGYDLQNNSAATRYVKFFNTTSVTMGTTGALFEVALNAGQSKTLQIPAGIGFGTGIFIAVTSGRGLTDNTATGLAAGDITGHIDFA